MLSEQLYIHWYGVFFLAVFFFHSIMRPYLQTPPPINPLLARSHTHSLSTRVCAQFTPAACF